MEYSPYCTKKLSILPNCNILTNPDGSISIRLRFIRNRRNSTRNSRKSKQFRSTKTILSTKDISWYFWIVETSTAVEIENFRNQQTRRRFPSDCHKISNIRHEYRWNQIMDKIIRKPLVMHVLHPRHTDLQRKPHIFQTNPKLPPQREKLD